MNKNPYAPKVPCHRVVNSDGKIGGFAEQLRGRDKNSKSTTRAELGVSGTKNKIKMLKREGINVIKGKIDLKKFGFKLK